MCVTAAVRFSLACFGWEVEESERDVYNRLIWVNGSEEAVSRTMRSVDILCNKVNPNIR
jgi:hypothetical protein